MNQDQEKYNFIRKVQILICTGNNIYYRCCTVCINIVWTWLLIKSSIYINNYFSVNWAFGLSKFSTVDGIYFDLLQVRLIDVQLRIVIYHIINMSQQRYNNIIVYCWEETKKSLCRTLKRALIMAVDTIVRAGLRRGVCRELIRLVGIM